MINIYATPEYKKMLAAYGAVSFTQRLRLRLKLLTLRVYGEEQLSLNEMNQVLLAVSAKQSSNSSRRGRARYFGLRPWQYLAFRKMINPFKLVALILGVALIVGEALSYEIFRAIDEFLKLCEKAIETLFWIVGYPTSALMYLFSFAFGDSNAKPFIRNAARWLRTKGARLIGCWASRLIYLARFALFLLLSAGYTVVNTFVFLINCVTSPVNAMIRPLIYGCRAKRLSSIFAVVLGLVSTSLIILAIAMSMGAVLPVSSVILQSVVNFIAPLSAFFTPVVTAIASFVGVITAKIALASAITLFTMTLLQRVFSGVAKFEFLKVVSVVMQTLQFNAPESEEEIKGNDFEAKTEKMMRSIKQKMSDLKEGVTRYLSKVKNSENNLAKAVFERCKGEEPEKKGAAKISVGQRFLNRISRKKTEVPESNASNRRPKKSRTIEMKPNIYGRELFSEPTDSKTVQAYEIGCWKKAGMEFRGLLLPFYAPTSDKNASGYSSVEMNNGV